MSLSHHIAFLINVTSARVLAGVIIDQSESILESSIPERPFVNNVYRRSLALAPPPPSSSVPRFPPRFSGVKFNSLLTDHRALLSERLG